MSPCKSNGYANILTYINIFTLAVLSCSRPNCDDTYILDKIQFFNSSINELNSIKIEGYSQGNNFTKIIDSSFYITEFEDFEDTYYGYLNKPIRTDLDYIFSFSLYNSVIITMLYFILLSITPLYLTG